MAAGLPRSSSLRASCKQTRGSAGPATRLGAARAALSGEFNTRPETKGSHSFTLISSSGRVSTIFPLATPARALMRRPRWSASAGQAEEGLRGAGRSARSLGQRFDFWRRLRVHRGGLARVSAVSACQRPKVEPSGNGALRSLASSASPRACPHAAPQIAVPTAACGHGVRVWPACPAGCHGYRGPVRRPYPRRAAGPWRAPVGYAE